MITFNSTLAQYSWFKVTVTDSSSRGFYATGHRLEILSTLRCCLRR